MVSVLLPAMRIYSSGRLSSRAATCAIFVCNPCPISTPPWVITNRPVDFIDVHQCRRSIQRGKLFEADAVFDRQQRDAALSPAIGPIERVNGLGAARKSDVA